MQKITVSYQEYDLLCRKVPEITCSLSRLPTKEEINKISSYKTGYFFSLLAWLVESEDGIPGTEDGDILREYVNDRIDDGIENYMLFQKDPEDQSERWKISSNDYEQVYETVEKIDFLEAETFPNVKQVNECFQPLVKFHFGFILFMLMKFKNKKKSPEYHYMKQLLEDNFELVSNEKKFKMTPEEYDKLCQSVEGCCVKRGKWWPTEEEINKIIIPNLGMCYDFIIWILETGPEPSNPKEEKSMKILQGIIRENTDFSETKEIPWVSDL